MQNKNWTRIFVSKTQATLHLPQTSSAPSPVKALILPFRFYIFCVRAISKPFRKFVFVGMFYAWFVIWLVCDSYTP
jgi:hypothetical protein